MACIRRLVLVVAVSFLVLAVENAHGRPTLRYALTPWPLCTAPCPVDDPGTSRLLLEPSRSPGSNGLVFKLKLTGLKKNGAPASVPNVRLYFFMYDDNFNCELHNSAPFDVVNGKASLTVTAGSLTPPVPDKPGGLFFACAVGVFDLSDDAILVGGLQRGDDGG